jgi:hypothetical protein
VFPKPRLAPILEATYEPLALQLVARPAIKDPVEYCRYIIEKTCVDGCPKCRHLLHDGKRGAPVKLTRRVGRSQAGIWVAPYQAEVFDTIAEARQVIADLHLLHAVIVDRCHPWNRG